MQPSTIADFLQWKWQYHMVLYIMTLLVLIFSQMALLDNKCDLIKASNLLSGGADILPIDISLNR